LLTLSPSSSSPPLAVLCTHSSFPSAASLPPICEETGSYVSAEDPDYDPAEELCNEVSALGINDDDLTYDTATTPGSKSEFFLSKKRGETKKNASIQGTTPSRLRYQLDYWQDSLGRALISSQFHLLSGMDTYKKTFVHLSTDQQHLVLISEVNQFLVNGGLAFETFLLDDMALSDQDKHYLQVILKHHPKKAARLVAVSKTWGCSNTAGKFYEQRIKLTRKCLHEFAKLEDGDEFFHGKKFVQYLDGSVHLHVELLIKPKDGYCPPEVTAAPVTMIASAANLPQLLVGGGGWEPLDLSQVAGLGGARVLQGKYNPSYTRKGSCKQTKGDQLSPPKSPGLGASDLMEQVHAAGGGHPMTNSGPRPPSDDHYQ
jgi:hypothetical protein